MATQPIISVIGATGGQGGAVARALLATGLYIVRALTRNAASEAAQKLAGQGAQVVQGNLNSRADLDKLFAGAYGAFAVTNFWDSDIFPGDIEKEQRQGYEIVDAAVAAKVSHLVWSSLHDFNAISGGRLRTIHYTGKNRVEEYARVRYPHLRATFFYAGFYASNLVNFPVFSPQKQADGSLVLAFPVPRNTRLPIFDVEDSGPVVAHIFANRDAFHHKRVLCGGYYTSVEEIAVTIAKVTGKKVTFQQIAIPAGMPEEFVDTFHVFADYGYYNGEDISEAQRIHPKMKTLEEWLRATKAFIN